jgi:hypothetical protein
MGGFHLFKPPSPTQEETGQLPQQAFIVDPPSISGEREPIHDPHEDHQPIRMLTEPSISGYTVRLLIHDPHEDYQPIRMLTEYDLFRYYQFIMPTKDEIKDRGKSDWLFKSFVLIHTTWFLMHCCARGRAPII